MTKAQILDTIRTLAFSQGFYGRLYNDIRNNDEALDYLEEQNFGDNLDLIMFLEGG